MEGGCPPGYANFAISFSNLNPNSVQESEDIRQVYQVMKEFSEATAPGAFIADLIPPLAKIPVFLQTWRTRALEYHRHQKDIWMRYWNNLQSQIASKRAPECFVKQFVTSDFDKQGISEVQGAFVAGSTPPYPDPFLQNPSHTNSKTLIFLYFLAMIEAGSETTSSALNSCIKYLAANPSVQARAAAELSAVIPSSRSPTFTDEPSLPYISAIVKEILRIRPVTNIGTPHYTTAPVTYKDYFIPANTVVSICQYAVHFDPSIYPDPFSFKPERFLPYPLKAGAAANQPDPEVRAKSSGFSFGAGRRICPGLHLAESSLFITVAKLMWAFEILPPLDGEGREEAVDVGDEAYEDGVNTLPKPFRVRFVPRSEERERVVREEWERARVEGYWMGGKKVEEGGMVVG
jgi:hypothetical protein